MANEYVRKRMVLNIFVYLERTLIKQLDTLEN